MAFSRSRAHSATINNVESLYVPRNKQKNKKLIAEQLIQSIYFIWFSGNKQPDFRTINRFRSECMKDVIYVTVLPHRKQNCPNKVYYS
ncbi:transposase [Bacillus sp. HMF5848]|nr:transposase [Bacillus sp. HMF5848]